MKIVNARAALIAISGPVLAAGDEKSPKSGLYRETREGCLAPSYAS
jgi:hypothetical protein